MVTVVLIPIKHLFISIKITSIDEWNILPQTGSYINEHAWGTVQTRLTNIFDIIYQEEDDEKDRLLRFLEQCMETADAKQPGGEQLLRKRVEAIVTILEQYVEKMKDLNLPLAKRESIKKDLIGRTLDLMAMGGATCPDNAIVLLSQAENHIKLFENPKYLPNILVNMFKLNAITDKLINPDNEENVETYLSYTLKLSDLLGLGISGDMLYEKVDRTEPLEKALPKLSKAFTAEALIQFAINREEFRYFFKDAKEKALEAKQKEYMDTYDMEDEEKAAEVRTIITQELKDIENSMPIPPDRYSSTQALL